MAIDRQLRESYSAFKNDIMNQWQTWVPTLTWTSATPIGIVTVARYKVIGKTCFVTIYISATNWNGATNLSITNLPSVPKANNARPILTSKVLNGGTMNGTRGAVVIDDGVSNSIGWPDGDMSAGTSGNTMKIYITGQYEVN